MNEERYWLGRAGQVYGPYEHVQLLEMQAGGELFEADQICADDGREAWTPALRWRSNVQPTAPTAGDGDSSVPTKDQATEKQRLFLEFLGVPVPKTKREATMLIEKLGEDAAYDQARAAWSIEKLKRHPELYAGSKVEADKLVHKMEQSNSESRIRSCYRFFTESPGLGNPFKHVALEKIRAVLGWLDERHPGWDRSLYGEFGSVNYDAADDWIIPAMAALYPELMKPSYRNDFGLGRRWRVL